MDIDRLCELAIKAIRHTVQYHSGINIAEGGALPALIRQEIHQLYHLRSTAKDPSVADLEIACDVALSVAETYNRAPQNQSKINLRWFYICIQGLLLVDIKPELLFDGSVARLPRDAQQQQQQPSQQPSQQSSQKNSQQPLQQPDLGSASLSPAGSSPTLGPESPPPSASSPDSSPEQAAPSSSSNAERMAVAKLPKSKWDDDEIQLMIELKASGMRHCDIATRIGRGQGAVENKYGRIMHQEEWKEYITEVEGNVKKKRKV